MKHVWILSFILLTACSVPPNSKSIPKPTETYYNPQTYTCNQLKTPNFSKLEPCMDFRGLVLKNLIIKNLDMQGSDFTKAIIENVTFIDVNLAGAKFFNTTLKNTKFIEGDLTKSFWVQSHLVSVELEEVNGQGAKWIDLSGERVSVSGNWSYLESRNTNLKEFKAKADFSYSEWFQGQIENSQLDYSIFYKSKFLTVDWSSRHKFFIQQVQQDVEISEEMVINTFKNTDFRDSIIYSSWFSFGDFFNAKFQRSQINSSFFQGTNLDQAAFIYAKIEGADFSSIVVEATPINNASLIILSGEDKIFKSKTRINLGDFSNSQVKFSNFNYVEIHNSFWTGSLIKSSNFIKIEALNNNFDFTEMDSVYFYQSILRSNNFNSSKLPISFNLSGTIQKTVDFIDCDLRFSTFKKAQWSFYDEINEISSGPSFEKSNLQETLWEDSNMKAASFKGSNLILSDLVNSLVDGAIFDSFTILPFSQSVAQSLGMIYQDP